MVEEKKKENFFKKHRGILTAGTYGGPVGILGYLGYEQLKKMMNKKKK